MLSLNSCQFCFVLAIMLYASCPQHGPLNRGLALSELRTITLPRTPVNRPAHTPLSTRLPLLVVAKIILLGDVMIRTILYAVLVVGASDRRTHKEFAPMSRSLW